MGARRFRRPDRGVRRHGATHPGNVRPIQNALGLGKSGVWAFDVNQTCLSFLTALDIAAMGMDTGRFKRALIVSSDIASAGLVPSSAAHQGPGCELSLR